MVDQDFTNEDRFKSYINMNTSAIGAVFESSPTKPCGNTSQLFPAQTAAMLPTQYHELIYGESPTLRNYNGNGDNQRASLPYNFYNGAYNLTSTPLQHNYQHFNTDPIDYQNGNPSYSSPIPNRPGMNVVPQSFIEFKQKQPFIMRSPIPPPPYHQPQPKYLPPHDLYIQPREFPSNFKPRSDANMPHKEKVNDWIRRVPVYYVPNTWYNLEGTQLQTGWYNECYPGVVSASSCNHSENYDGNLLDEMDEDFEISQVDQNHGNNSTSAYNVVNLGYSDELYVDHEDILEFQARKITKYVKKLYQQDPSEKIVKGNSPTKNTTLIDGFDKSNLSQLLEGTEANPVDITNTSYNLNLTEAIEQINSKRYLNEDINDLIINNADKQFETNQSRPKRQSPVTRKKN